MQGVLNETITIRSETEVQPYFLRRVYLVIPIVILLVFLYLASMIAITGGGMPLWQILIIAPFPSLLPILLVLDFLLRTYFSLDVVKYDENSLTLSRTRNILNRKTWILPIPYERVATIRQNGDRYEVVRTDGSVVPLPKRESNIGTYHRIGRELQAYLEAETGEGVPFRLPGMSPPPDPAIDYLGNEQLRKEIKAKESTIGNLFTPGLFIILGLVFFGVTTIYGFISHQPVDQMDTTCFGTLAFLFFLLIRKYRTTRAEIRTAKATLGKEQYEPYLRDHVILVTRPGLGEGVVDGEGNGHMNEAIRSRVGNSRVPVSISGWKDIPRFPNATQRESMLITISGLLILPLLLSFGFLIFRIVHIVGFYLDESPGIDTLIHEMYDSFCLLSGGLFLFLLVLYLSLKNYVTTGDRDGIGEIEQAIEERYWGRKAEKQEWNQKREKREWDQKREKQEWNQKREKQEWEE